ncbi:MAG: FtsX-like permease family protein [Mediterranea massiliensis]|nr:FtsX-like permease family protein [Mediterranea massiliensis]
MITHYLKVAVRNLMKYKTQTVVSIVELAIGFACFALSTMWIRYEMSYDTRYDGSERLYILYTKTVFEESGYTTSHNAYPFVNLLRNEFPEVEEAFACLYWQNEEIKAPEGEGIKVPQLIADSCFFSMFEIELLDGSMEFLEVDEQVALTEQTAKRLFGTTDVVGKKIIEDDKERTVCAVLKDLEHSNFSFGIWNESGYYRKTFWDNWTAGGNHIVIKLRKGVDAEAFEKKLNASTITGENMNRPVFASTQLMPLSDYHYSDINPQKSVKFEYLIMFSAAGGLVILCSLINYLSLFITRMNIRRKEIALRKVCGSSVWGLLGLFSTEYFLMLLGAGLMGMCFVELAYRPFAEISGVTGGFYLESLYYYVVIMCVSLLLMVPFVLRRTPARQQGNDIAFRKFNIVFQLVVGILFIFCMSVIMKQLYHLKNVDLGWERKNIASFPFIYPNKELDEIADKLKAMSCTREVLSEQWGLLPTGAQMSLPLKGWEGGPDSTANFDIKVLPIGKEVVEFYQLKLIDGVTEINKNGEESEVLINEAGAKALGLHDPVGKELYLNKGKLRIVGYIKDFHITSPTVAAPPTLMIGKDGFMGFGFGGGHTLVKYHEGKWPELKQQVEEMFTRDYPHVNYRMVNVEDEYNKYLESEQLLLKLLGFVAVVCMLISAFGIFSLITLSCEQRRKEIAIRKVNGARVEDILRMFGNEYLRMLVIASVIGFPISYFLMKSWLQNYVMQTSISWWIYASIFLLLALVIALCIGWRVWKAARQNPAEVVKSE